MLIWARYSETLVRLDFWRQTINQVHEGYENGKSYLPRSCVLLYLFGRFRRQPSSRMSLRRVVLLADQHMEGAKAPGLMVLPLHSHIRPHEHDMCHGAGATQSDPAQSRPGQCWAGVVRAHYAIGGINGTVMVVALADLLNQTCQRRARSGYPPSRRAGLFVVGEHHIPGV